MNRKSILALRLATLALVLLLVSCSLPGSTRPAATEIAAESTGEAATEEATQAVAAEIPVFEIPPGAVTTWWDGSAFVYAPAGEYLMGDAEATEGDNLPAHAVSLDGFWIHQAEVTNRMYAQCVALGVCPAPANTGSTVDHYNNPDFAEHPVVNVTWEGARVYCEWIGGALPSEAQWEWAARGETGQPYYPWGDEDPNCSRSNYQSCITPTFTTPVDNYPLGLSPFYLADTAGNVFEWVYDWYGQDYYAGSPTGNPTGPETGTERVVRSSSFRSPLEELPVVERFSQIPAEARDDLGFRCILTGETIAAPPLPACNMLAYVPIPRPLPQPEGQIPPAFSLGVYCGLDANNNQYGSAQIVFEPITDVGSVTLSSPNGTLACNQDQNDPLLFTCLGSALHPGDPVTISACYPPPPAQPFPDPTCPMYYHLNPSTAMCEYGVPIPVACPVGDIAVFGYGCLHAPVNGDCPNGTYLGDYDNHPVCIPAGGPICQGQNCPAVCPEGMTFDEGNFCCQYPQDVLPVCPTGYTYYTHVAACLPDDWDQPNNCTSITTLVPTCAPQPTTGCLISTTNPRTGQVTTTCVYPCPAEGQNGGPCTP